MSVMVQVTSILCGGCVDVCPTLCLKIVPLFDLDAVALDLDHDGAEVPATATIELDPASYRVIDPIYAAHTVCLSSETIAADGTMTFTDEDGEVIIRREIQVAGKGRATVNGALVPVSTLRDLAPRLAVLPPPATELPSRRVRPEALMEALQRCRSSWSKRPGFAPPSQDQKDDHGDD